MNQVILLIDLLKSFTYQLVMSSSICLSPFLFVTILPVLFFPGPLPTNIKNLRAILLMQIYASQAITPPLPTRQLDVLFF